MVVRSLTTPPPVIIVRFCAFLVTGSTALQTTQIEGDAEALRALDRLLGIGKEVTEERANNQEADERQDSDEEDMPLVCDVCGKLPDVEVRNIDTSTENCSKAVDYTIFAASIDSRATGDSATSILGHNERAGKRRQ